MSRCSHDGEPSVLVSHRSSAAGTHPNYRQEHPHHVPKQRKKMRERRQGRREEGKVKDREGRMRDTGTKLGTRSVPGPSESNSPLQAKKKSRAQRGVRCLWICTAELRQLPKEIPLDILIQSVKCVCGNLSRDWPLSTCDEGQRGLDSLVRSLYSCCTPQDPSDAVSQSLGGLVNGDLGSRGAFDFTHGLPALSQEPTDPPLLNLQFQRLLCDLRSQRRSQWKTGFLLVCSVPRQSIKQSVDSWLGVPLKSRVRLADGSHELSGKSLDFVLRRSRPRHHGSQRLLPLVAFRFQTSHECGDCGCERTTCDLVDLIVDQLLNLRNLHRVPSNLGDAIPQRLRGLVQ
mmetsp:Transcript_4509/g.12695  ORF Transcript_4509/g.12695 Transcript_4509/m.12695 type:complete len:344 (-) Transcript_4509:1167-2198(-)